LHAAGPRSPLAFGGARQKAERAEVSNCDIDILGLYLGEHGFKQVSLLCVAVSAANHLHYKPGLRLQHDERLSG
jgi:hypothetical protein